MEKQLLNLLDNPDARKQYRYLLIDNLVSLSYFHILSIQSLQENLGKEAVEVVPRTDLAHDLAHCPKLVVIAKPNEPINKKLLHHISNEMLDDGSIEKRYISACIVSKNDPKKLSEQLINIGLKLAKLIQTNFVPFYEPFKTFLMLEGNKICPEWLSTLLGCCSTYCFTSFTNHLYVIQSLTYTPKPQDIFVTEEVKFYLKESNNLYHLAIAWKNLCERKNKNVTDDDIIQLAEFYKTAKISGLEDTYDSFSLALALISYPNLSKQTKLKDAIEKAKEEPGTLANYLSEIDIAE